MNASHPDSAYTLYDAPRTNVQDHTRFWVNALLAPLRIRNAHGRETRIRYSTRFPLLPDSVHSPTGVWSTATYDTTRALVTSTRTARLDTPSDTATIVSSVLWHSSIPSPARVISGSGADTVYYYYDASGVLDSTRSPATGMTRISYYASGDGRRQYRRSTVPSTAATDSVVYDTLGNVSWSKDRRGHATSVSRDVLGRAFATLAPLSRRDSITFDIMGRVVLARSFGDSTSYTPWSQSLGTVQVPAQVLYVRTKYDDEGRTAEVARWTVPNPAGIDTLFATTDYDAAGRPVSRFGSEVAEVNLTYDPSGLLVAEMAAAIEGGRQLTMEYDALGRLTRRIAAGVEYWSRDCEEFAPWGADGASCNFEFPLWPAVGMPVWIAADTAEFTYDHGDRLLRADNQHARIRRVWTPGGRLLTDSAMIRTLRYEHEGALLPGTDFQSHQYVLNFGYDLAGRRTSLSDATAIKPCSGSTCTQTYAYSAATGRLASVTDPRGKVYSFAFNAAGQLDTLYYPGSVLEHPTYDAEGNVVRRRVWRSGTTFLNDTITYDAAGRVTHEVGVVVNDGTARESDLAYSGLGALVMSETQIGSAPTRLEEFRLDGNGNQTWSRRHHVVLGNIDNPAVRETFYDAAGRFDYSYAPDTGNVWDFKQAWYDDLGRLAYRGTTSNTWGSGQSTQYAQEAHYYDGLGRLAMFQRKSNDLQQESISNDPSAVVERYRYDALGRRVLVHTNRIHACTVAKCDRTIRRMVWDGDNLLYEIRQKASDTTSSATVESDLLGGGGLGSAVNQFGRVFYVHAGGIDRPLGVIRLASTSLVAAFSPIANWRGLYEGGTDSTGTLITNAITWPGEAASAHLGVAPSSTPEEWH